MITLGRLASSGSVPTLAVMTSEALWVGADLKSRPSLLGLGFGEEAVVEADFGVHGVRGADPMDRAFDFACGGRAASLTVEIGGATGSVMLPLTSLTTSSHFDDVGVFQPHFAAGLQTEEFRRRHFGEVVALDVEFAAERDFAFAGGFVLGIIGKLPVPRLCPRDSSSGRL